MGPHSKLMEIEPKYLTRDKEAIKGFLESFDVSTRKLLEKSPAIIVSIRFRSNPILISSLQVFLFDCDGVYTMSSMPFTLPLAVSTSTR